MKKKAVILAGGQGSRFWPMSRIERPKQFLALGTSEESLLQSTVKRVEKIVGKGNVIVVASNDYVEEILKHTPEVTIIEEPMAKNTAPCIGLAASLIAKEDPETVLLVFPADHAVEGSEGFEKIFNLACEVASKEDVLVTIGMQPTKPNTAYGYIQREEKPFFQNEVYRVKRFYEKPSIERAQQYVENKDFYWNSGMFVWRASSILRAIETHVPQLSVGLQKIQKAYGTAEYTTVLKAEFLAAEAVSIDLGVMEHAKNVVVIPADCFSWNDVGSWDAWAEQFKADKDKNVLPANAISIDSTECVVLSNIERSYVVRTDVVRAENKERLIALVGLENIFVIDTDDALLICHKDKAQEVKKVVEKLKVMGKTAYL